MIRIVTDSSVNLPTGLVERFRISVVPLNVHFGEEQFQEGVNISEDEFYRRLPESRPLPTTSQPAAGQFQDIYKASLSQGDEVLSVHLSSRLSGTYASAATARSMLREAPITLLDTGTVSVGLSMLVLAAAQAAELGWSCEAIVGLLEKMAARTIIFFTVDTLEYLHRGGRIGTASAWMGTLLQVKPLLAIRQGEVLPIDRVRTRKRAVRRLLDLLAEHSAGADSWWAGVAHAKAEQEAGRFGNDIIRELPVAAVIQVGVGPVVGAHGGIGTLGAALTPDPATFGVDFPPFSVILGENVHE